MKLKKIVKIGSLIFGFYFILLYILALCLGILGPNCLPAHLKNKDHSDYSFPGTQKIPRYATSWCLVEPPLMLLGNQKNSLPLPEKGSWQFSIVIIKKNWPFVLPYFALTTKTGLHFRIGCRWDNIDHYYVFPSIALRYLHKDHQ